MAKQLIDLEMRLHVETANAILASDDGDRDKAVWLPKSQIEFEAKLVKGEHYATVTMPEWLATEKGLV